MIDTQARTRAYIKLMGFVIVLGLITALITFAFITSPFETSTPMAVAVVVSALLTALLVLYTARRAADQSHDFAETQ